MPQLSRRTNALIEKGNRSALGNALFKTFASQYSEENPKGVVNAGLAENVSRDLCCGRALAPSFRRASELTSSLRQALLQPWLKEFFERSVDLKTTDFTYGEFVRHRSYRCEPR
jgi:hypothetical protein